MRNEKSSLLDADVGASIVTADPTSDGLVPSPDNEGGVSWWTSLQRNARSRGFRWTPFNVSTFVVAAFFALLAAYPLSRVVQRLVYNDGFNLDAVRGVWNQPDLGRLLLNTLIVVAASGVFAVLGGVVLAWLIERTNARMGPVTDSLPLIPFLVPAVAGSVGWVMLLSERGGLLNAFLRFLLGGIGIEISEGPFNIYSLPGLIFVYTLYTIPYTYMMLSTGLRNMDSSLEEQARICGSSSWRTIRTVTVPGMMPSVGGAALLAVWHGTALLSVPLIIGSGARIDVLSVRIVRILKFQFPPDTASAVGLSMFVVLAVGLAWALQRRILQKGQFVTVKGKNARRSRIDLGAWKWPARLVILGYGVLSLLLPAIALILIAGNGFWTPNIAWGSLSLDSFRSLLDDNLTRRAFENSLRLGFLGATVGIAAAALIAVFVSRMRDTAIGKVVDGAVKIPAVFSSIVLAVGFVLAFSGPPFNLNSTFWILMLGYMALYLPQASVAADAAVAQAGSELPEASYVCGAGPARTFYKINLPIMTTALAAGWALLFARMAGDLTMSAVLAGPGNPVVGLRILEIFEGGSFAALASLSLALTMVTSSVVLIVLVVVRRSSSQVGLAAGD